MLPRRTSYYYDGPSHLLRKIMVNIAAASTILLTLTLPFGYEINGTKNLVESESKKRLCTQDDERDGLRGVAVTFTNFPLLILFSILENDPDR